MIRELIKNKKKIFSNPSLREHMSIVGVLDVVGNLNNRVNMLSV